MSRGAFGREGEARREALSQASDSNPPVLPVGRGHFRSWGACPSSHYFKLRSFRSTSARSRQTCSLSMLVYRALDRYLHAFQSKNMALNSLESNANPGAVAPLADV